MIYTYDPAVSIESWESPQATWAGRGVRVVLMALRGRCSPGENRGISG